VILRLTVQDINSRQTGDFEINASPDDWVGSLLNVLPGVSQGDVCFIGAAMLDPGARIAGSPLLPGAVLSVGGAGPDYHPVRGAAAGTLHVIAGPDAGFGVALRPGRYFIGRSPDAHVYLHDVDVSRTHALVEVSAAGAVMITDGGSRNGTWVNGARLAVPTALDDGSVARLGNDVLRWAPGVARALRVLPTRDGRLEFDRLIAATPEIPAQRVDASPPGPAPRGFVASGRRSRAIAEARAAARERVAAAVAEEERARHLLAPGPADVTAMATGARPDLWARDTRSPHGLALRIGVADQPPSVRLVGPPGADVEVPDLRAVPVTVDLRATGAFGVIGGGEPATALLRWLIVQLATLRSPDDLRLVLLTADGDGRNDGLAWTRWLPHLEGEGTTETPCLIGNTGASRAARIGELRKLIVARAGGRPGRPATQAATRASARASARAAARAMAGFDGEVVVVLDGAAALLDQPGMRDILRLGPPAGVYVLCADRQPVGECLSACEVTAEGLRLTRGPESEPVTGLPDRVDQGQAEQVARALAPMRDRVPAAAAAAIPYPVRLLDLLGMEVPSALDVLALWSEKREGPTTRVVLGADGSGSVAVDLAAQGPHALLAGAAGAGKTVLLQTLVTALLLANRPDEMNLVLADPAGGGAFPPFEHCPHVTAVIRSMDESDAARMLASVRAEIGRRETILSGHGGDIDNYWRARELQPALPRLPRIVMVFDEADRVLDVAPGFLADLVDATANGRPLGVHVVLATRSPRQGLPTGLKNGLDLRISLRQDEAADSAELLGVPDAIIIPAVLRGRGVILCTRDEPRTPHVFQSGYLGDPPPAWRDGRLTVRPLDWADLGTPGPPAKAAVDGSPTDLSLVIRAIEEATRHIRIMAP
jgi:DNA segregation ATPase FtsK/SpoIIIE, S-DNA-T family